MSSVLPHSTVIAADARAYLGDVEERARRMVGGLQASAGFRRVYKLTLAADTVLSGLAMRAHRPRLSGARAVLRRVPLLTALGQLPAARMELRRFVELLFWTVYFTDHPREWRVFESLDGGGIERDDSRPITRAARREPVYYRNYAKELLCDEPSGMGKQAVDRLAVAYSQLSGVVHPARIAAGPRIPPVSGPLKEADMKAFASSYASVTRDAALMLAAVSRRAFDHLSPAARAWLDKLLGRQASRRLRSGPFGLTP